MTPTRARARRYRGAAIWASVGIALGGRLLAGRVVPIVSSDRSEGTLLFVGLGAGLALLAAVVLVVLSAVALVCGRAWAVFPLLAGAGALAAFFLVPWRAPMLAVDDEVHRAAREDIVRRLEEGELSRSGTLAAVPREYPWAVSACGGHNLVSVVEDQGGTRVLFCPHGGFGNGHWWLVYDSADRAPGQSDQGLYGFGFERVERLRERWYRVLGD